jgi:hypothetical protein
VLPDLEALVNTTDDLKIKAHDPAGKAKGRVHSYRTLEERIERGRAWRQTTPPAR